jgi:hypothetical protein
VCWWVGSLVVGWAGGRVGWWVGSLGGEWAGRFVRQGLKYKKTMPLVELSNVRTERINIDIEGKEYNHAVILCIFKTKFCSRRNYFKCQIEDPLDPVCPKLMVSKQTIAYECMRTNRTQKL